MNEEFKSVNEEVSRAGSPIVRKNLYMIFYRAFDFTGYFKN